MSNRGNGNKGGKQNPQMKSMGHVQQTKPTRSSSGDSKDIVRWSAILIAICGICSLGYFMFLRPPEITTKAVVSQVTSTSPAPKVGVFEINLPRQVVLGRNEGHITFASNPRDNARIILKTSNPQLVKIDPEIRISDANKTQKFTFKVGPSSSQSDQTFDIAATLKSGDTEPITETSKPIMIPPRPAAESTLASKNDQIRKPNLPGGNEAKETVIFDWKVLITIASFILSLVAVLVALYVALDKSRKSSLVAISALSNDLRAITTDLDEMRTLFGRQANSAYSPPDPDINAVTLTQLEYKMQQVRAEIEDLAKFRYSQFEHRFEKLDRAIVEILKSSKDSVIAVPTELALPALEPISKLTLDEQQLLMTLQNELVQPTIFYGRIKLCTNRWHSFSPELRNEFLQTIRNYDVDIIEPVRGQDIDRATMEFDSLPDNFKMLVDEVVMLGFRVHSTGDVFPAKVTVE